MLAAAFVIHPMGTQKLTLFDMTLPPMCGMKMSTGLPCPGCGLTRSWVLLAHGDFAGSLALHRLGWLTMLYVFLQAIRHGSWLALPAKRAGIHTWGSKLDKAIILLGIALVLNWPLLLHFVSRAFGQ